MEGGSKGDGSGRGMRGGEESAGELGLNLITSTFPILMSHNDDPSMLPFDEPNLLFFESTKMLICEAQL